MAYRLMTLAVWALLAASTVFWGMRIFVSGSAVPAQAQLPARSVPLSSPLQRLLGGVDEPEDDAPLADESGRFQLLGVVAPRDADRSPQGVALISVDGEPAKAWRTGAILDGDLVLLAVGPRSVQLGPRGGPASTELTLPEPSPVAVPLRAGAMGLGARAPGLPGQVRPGVVAAQPVQHADAGDGSDEEIVEDE